MAVKSNMIFVNLPVKDLQASMQFFGQMGFEFNPMFTDENAACLVIGDNIFAMLLVEPFFQTFTKRAIADATKTTEVLIAISAGSKEQVDELADKALAAGGSTANEPQDHGFMYSRSISDLDGHIWEISYMDMDAVGGQA